MIKILIAYVVCFYSWTGGSTCNTLSNKTAQPVGRCSWKGSRLIHAMRLTLNFWWCLMLLGSTLSSHSTTSSRAHDRMTELVIPARVHRDAALTFWVKLHNDVWSMTKSLAKPITKIRFQFSKKVNLALLFNFGSFYKTNFCSSFWFRLKTYANDFLIS